MSSKLSGGNASVASEDNLPQNHVREVLSRYVTDVSYKKSPIAVSKSIKSIQDNYMSTDSDSDNHIKSKSLLAKTTPVPESKIIRSYADAAKKFKQSTNLIRVLSEENINFDGSKKYDKKIAVNQAAKKDDFPQLQTPITKSQQVRVNIQEASTVTNEIVNSYVKDNNSKTVLELYPANKILLGWDMNRDWKVGNGMLNLGNNCYINSVLQAILHVPSIVNWLVDDHETEKCCINKDSMCIICTVYNVFESTQDVNSTINNVVVFRKLREYYSDFPLSFSRQEDAHEFLKYLLESIEKAYIERSYKWHELDATVRQTTPLGQIFGGEFVTQIQCRNCSFISESTQYFQDILLDISYNDDYNCITIDDALNHYFAKEIINDCVYDCSNCQQKVAFSKQFLLKRAPKVLCLQIKRFSNSYNKIHHRINYKQHINLRKYVVNSEQINNNNNNGYRYRLASTINHYGQMTSSGHYTAMAQTSKGMFYHFNDAFVRICTMSDYLSMEREAYILMYELHCPNDDLTKIIGKTDEQLPSQLPSQLRNKNQNKKTKGSGGPSVKLPRKHLQYNYNCDIPNIWKFSNNNHYNKYYNYAEQNYNHFSAKRSYHIMNQQNTQENMWIKRRKLSHNKYQRRHPC